MPDGANGAVGEDVPSEVELDPWISFESRPALTVPSRETVVAPAEEGKKEAKRRLSSCLSSTWGFCCEPRTHRSPSRMRQFVRIIVE